MKWKNKGHEYDQFAELWSTREEYSLWGAAYTGRKFCSRFKSRLKIHEFYDSNPAKIGTVFEGYPVNAFAENTTSPRRKIIVTSGAYWEIRLKLLAAGLVENVDFCDSKLFTAVFQMYHLGELCLSRVDLVITNKCTLRCRDCNMSIPSFSDPQHVDINLLKQDLDAYFSYVDYLDKLDLLGGEPFLYPQLPELLTYIHENYQQRIDNIEFFSNATILPSEQVLKACQEYDISIQISDYSKELPHCREKVERMIEELEKRGIRYTRFNLENWLDFDLMNHVKEQASEAEMIRFCDLCAPPFRGLYDRKLYFCHLNTSAVRAGLYENSANDYFDLSKPDSKRKMELLEFDSGFSTCGYITFCRRCNGCNSVNTRTVPGAIQLKQI